MVIPASRLHLHVVALRVESERAVGGDVEGEGLIGGRRVYPLRPKSLVQRADLEDKAPVQDRARRTALVGGDANGAEAEVALE